MTPPHRPGWQCPHCALLFSPDILCCWLCSYPFAAEPDSPDSLVTDWSVEVDFIVRETDVDGEEITLAVIGRLAFADSFW